MEIDEVVDRVLNGSWPDRVDAVRLVPSEFPGKEHSSVYAEISRAFYAQQLAPQFHIVPWREVYTDRAGFFAAYDAAVEHTEGFSTPTAERVASAIRAEPRSLRIFRLIIGYTTGELAATLSAFAERPLSKANIERLEAGGEITKAIGGGVESLAKTVTSIVRGEGGFSVSDELRERGFRAKTDKPDTEEGWTSVEHFAADGVPYVELLYQRFYGGAFRQIQDAGGILKGELLEDATEALFRAHGVPYVRTVAGTQATAGGRFGITVQPAPDFILHDGQAAKGLLECKSAGDGGTARDKAGRFSNLRRESQRLGGIPVLAVIDGLGWQRVNDALGPVVRDCDGRVFTLKNIDDLLAVDPVRGLMGLATRP